MLIEEMIFVVLIAIMGGASLAGLMYIWFRAAQRPTPNAGIANCGRCGYALFGIKSMTCPECGADFTSVGIISPNMRKRYISPIAFVMLWALCLIIPAIGFSTLAIYLGPKKQVFQEDLTLQPTDQQASNYDSINLSRSHIGTYTSEWEDDLMLGNNDFLDVSISGLKDETDWVEISLNTLAVDDGYGRSIAGNTLTRANVQALFTKVGANLSSPEVQSQVDELYTLITNAKANGIGSYTPTYFVSTSSSTWPREAPRIWFIALQPILWLVVFFAGIGLYIFMHQRYCRRQNQLTLQAIQTQQQ